MAEIVALVVRVIELGKHIASPIKRQLNYLCCFTSNMQSLNNESEKLKTKRDGLQMRVDEEKRNLQVIVPTVNQWLDDSDQTQAKKIGIEADIANVRCGCFAIKSRYSLSRKAKKTAEAMTDLRERCPSDQEIAVRPHLAAMAPIRQPQTGEFESRKQIEEEIMKDLEGREVHVMGICGMGGLGKTTMAKKIRERVREKNLFEEVVMVVISQEVRVPEIQSEIAEKLGLTLREGSLSARADKLHARLKGPEKSILLIFDDVWEELNLEDIGIPCKSDLGERSAILLTSRNKDVLTKMDAKTYSMKVLTENESWFLFREKVGTWVDDSELLSIAKEIEKECKGLPLALVIVGTALKINGKSKPIWEHFLSELRSANPRDMPDVRNKVYKHLRLSYHYLENHDARSLFLLCCLFPEDHDIPLERLTIYGIGLSMFKGMSVEGARNRTHALLEELKGRFLLLDGRDENHVRMHDVVRDVAIFIASEERRVSDLSLTDSSSEESINSNWISVVGEEINKLTAGLSFPCLHLLLMNSRYEIRLENFFFEGMTELKVLSFSSIEFRSLPETAHLLKELRTLYLEYCRCLETIPVVGNLLSLEIFICRGCGKIEELPVEIGRLKRLKLLEVSECWSLKRIAPGVISNLIRLEELTIVKSFSGWQTKAGNGVKTENAALCELEHLKNLTTLRIEIANATLAAEEICLSSKIVKYGIRFTGNDRYSYPYDEELYERKMNLISDFTFEKWIQMFVTSTQYLYVSGEGARTLDITQTQKMKKLVLENCSKVNELVNLTASVDRSVGVFPLLESLTLRKLSNLGEICDGPILKSSNSFGNLKELNLQELPALQHIWKSPHQNVSLCNLSEINLWECGKLRELFPLAIARECLPELKKLTVRSCAMMEQVFSDDENGNNGEQCHRITFAKLHDLVIGDLPKLQRFCNWGHELQFPSLRFMTIYRCRPLLEFFITEFGHTPNLESIEIGDDNVSNMWGHQTPLGLFRQLQKLEIVGCNGIRSLFSASMVANLLHLEQLSIIRCSEIVKVIEDDKEMSCEKSHFVLPCLKDLYLENLPKLERFCNRGCNLQLPSLEDLSIVQCHLSEFFTIESVKSCQYYKGIKRITIWDWKFTRSLFPYSVAKNLVNLECLEIWLCNEMAQVIDDDEELLCAKSNPLFPCLKELNLNYLPKLESFWNWRCDLELPSLEHVMIISCPLFKQFASMGSVTTPNLKSINIDFEDKAVGDLNSVMQLHFTDAEQKKCVVIDEVLSSTALLRRQWSEEEEDSTKGEIEEEDIKEEIQ